VLLSLSEIQSFSGVARQSDSQTWTTVSIVPVIAGFADGAGGGWQFCRGTIGGGCFNVIVSHWSYAISPASTGAAPLPAAFPLFASGLGALGLFGCARKRRKKIAG